MDQQMLISALESTDSTSLGIGAVFGILAGLGIAIIIFALIIAVLSIIAMWRIFTKAGEKGWKSIIPIYNVVVLFRIIGISPWWILGFLTAVIPVVGPLFIIGMSIYSNIKLGKAFGKSTGFIVGLVLLNTIFTLILGFGDSEYQLEKNA